MSTILTPNQILISKDEPSPLYLWEKFFLDIFQKFWYNIGVKFRRKENLNDTRDYEGAYIATTILLRVE